MNGCCLVTVSLLVDGHNIGTGTSTDDVNVSDIEVARFAPFKRAGREMDRPERLEVTRVGWEGVRDGRWTGRRG
eukprot:3932555-Rhodomonas_salina.2